MDVSTSTKAKLPILREIHCNVCGYPRVGLPDDSRCPECGTPPPKPIVGLSDAAGVARDRSEQAWLVSVAMGIMLLVVSSYFAIQVDLMTPLGGLTLMTVNAPGPKLCAAALLLRSIGNPGVWGVTGTLAVLGNVLAIWLITEPQSIRAGEENTFSIRKLTRWSCIITCGGLLGVLLAGYDTQSVWWQWSSLPILTVVMAAVELPTNTLLYLHLTQLARRFDGDGDRSRSITLLRASAWMIAMVCISGAAISLIRGAMEDQPVAVWRVVQAAYGALALGTGMCMTVGVLYLAARVVAASMDQSIITLAGKLTWLRTVLARVLGAIRSDPQRYAAAAGLLLWLWIARPMIGMGMMIEHRRGLGGDLPQLNFIGPKVWAVGLLEYHYDGYIENGANDRIAIVLAVVAIWLITSYRPASVRRSFQLATRWLPTILIGLAVGFDLTIEQSKQNLRDSYWVAILMLGVEAPATLVAYLYLSSLAATSQPKLAKQIKMIAFAAAGLILSPLGFYLLSKPLRKYDDSWPAYGVGAIYGAIVLAVGILAWALLVKLIWILIQPASRDNSA